MRPAYGIQVQALYTASCQRDIGVIVNVSSSTIYLLNLNGEIVTIPRYEVIYYATYPIDTVPISEVKDPRQVPLIEIKTYQNGDLTTLVRGWAVDFSQDKIAFLTLNGVEVMIDRTSIWEVGHDEENRSIKFIHPPQKKYTFAQPYAFAACDANEPKSSVQIFPQQLFSDPINIKRELDRLADGYAQIRKYEDDQQFYPIPEIYANETSLGMWLMLGSRYGGSTSRANNYTPLLVNQFSNGPFGFQSIFTSGSGPLFQSIHEETQTQIYYRMKADYFHFSAMVDPNLLLVGSNYNWTAKDMDVGDIRAVESAFVELGFDYGRFALELYPGGVVNIGARENDFFNQKSALSLQKIGIRYQGYHWLFNLIYGSAGAADGFSASLIRANVEWYPDANKRWVLSVLDRKLSFSGPDAVNSANQFQVAAQSYTGALYGYFRFKKRYWAGGMLAVESVDQSAGTSSTTSQSKVYPKAGTTLALSF